MSLKLDKGRRMPTKGRSTDAERSWFLRFYGAGARLRAEQCLRRIRDRGHVFTESFGPVTQSINFMADRERVQVTMVFSSKANRTKFKNDKGARNIYGKLGYVQACPVAVRRPGDAAFSI